MAWVEIISNNTRQILYSPDNYYIFDQHKQMQGLNLRTIYFICILFLAVYARQQCSRGSFWNAQQQKCSLCTSPCEKCDSAQCLTADDATTQSSQQNIGINNLSRLLTVCPVNCSACNGGGQCTQCNDGYAMNGGVGACSPCHTTCLTCTTPNNDGTCSTCSTGRVLDGSNYCRTCPYYYNSLCIQCNVHSCLLCAPGYYVASGSSCLSCNPSALCLTCTSSTDCLTCVPYYEVYNNTCVDICGDSYAITLPCDNPIGVPYDGCSDSCTIMTDFACVITNHSTVCSYMKAIALTNPVFIKQSYDNNFQLKLTVYPPLPLLSQDNLMTVFQINNTMIKLQSISYSDGQLTLNISYTENVFNMPFILHFIPNTNYDPRFFATPASSINLTIDTNPTAYFYTANMITLEKVIRYSGIVIIVLAWIAYFLGIKSCKLAGVELMIMLQSCWILFLCVQSKSFPISYLSLDWLKYSFGYSFLSQSTSNTTVSSASSSNPLSSYIKFSTFKMDPFSFINNFNLSLILYFIPVLCIIIFRVLSLKNKYKQIALTKYQFAVQMLMYGVAVNILPVTVYSAVYFSGIISAHNLTQYNLVPNSVVFGVSTFITLLTFAAFFKIPDLFNRFRYSFINQCLSLHHFYLYILFILCATMINLLLSQPNWACIIPIAALMLEIICFRPFKQNSQNLRSGFYLLVICLAAGFRIVYISAAENWRSSQFVAYLLIGLQFLFLATVIWAYVEILRNIFVKEPQPVRSIEYTMFEDLELMKQISKPQNFLHLTGIDPTKTTYHEIINQNQHRLNNVRNNKYLKFRNNFYHHSKQQNEQFNSMHGNKIIINNSNKRLKYQSSDKKDEISDQVFSSEADDDRKQPQIEKQKFQLHKKPIFEQIFSYVNDESKQEESNQISEQCKSKELQKQVNNLQKLDQQSKIKIKNELLKQIKYIKFKNVLQYVKPNDQQLLEHYEAI